jgi:benzoate-CoA ligase
MLRVSSADHGVSPPIIDLPAEYNAARDLIERNLRAGRGSKLAYIDDEGTYTYAELDERVNRCAGALLKLGLQPEQRVLLCLQDTIDFPTVFLGCITAGLIPVTVNTLLTTPDYDHLLRDSRARALVVTESLLPWFAPLIGHHSSLKHVIVSHVGSNGAASGTLSLSQALAEAPGPVEPYITSPDNPCFWLYSSGSTGAPKGTVHAHGSLIQTAELYARPILGLREDDRVFSAAKLFFAYGLGNALTFPLAVGATAVLMRERPTPEAVFARLRRHHPTVFCGVPTLYASLLAASGAPEPAEIPLRACISAGECLPAGIGEEWTRRFGIDILDGIGSTEMLHIFLSNRPGQVQYGTTGTPVPGYQVRLVDEEGHPVPDGEIGELQVAGPTAALGYWNNREKNRQTFYGPWTRTGDKYFRNNAGRYVHAGRADDMLKVGGIYVSPVEVESALISHPAVLEAAVVGREDPGGLIKPLAYIVPRADAQPGSALVEELKLHVKSRLAPFKYPRWIEFLPELPKTATGKIQRFKLRDLAFRRSQH